ncbi:hypothetical protein [Glutamicibacter creatinolyticus]|uniref:hypothetical protein n=1 Tax=Glutamicibacter creatinolyticus TaxID=162496 RepID=UPI0031D7A768
MEELLCIRAGREFLSQYGWADGIPVIAAYPSELVDDVMGLLSMQGQPGLVAMCDERSASLSLMHVSLPLPALQIVKAVPAQASVRDLLVQAKQRGVVTFRSKYWRHSAVAHALPPVPAGSFPAVYRQRLLAA